MPTDAQLATARSLRIDTVTGEVVRALAAAGVPSIVLKGPAIARLLYDGALRPYGDSDVLVPSARLDEAEEVLARLGFEQLMASEDVPSGVSFHHASPWGRNRDYIDLHWSLPQASADPARVWDVLAPETRGSRIGGADAAVLGGAGTALLASLHMAHHGAAGGRKAMADLERALERLPQEDWRRARALAAQLDELEPFAAGLRMCAPGAALADALGLPRSSSVHLAIAAGGGPGTAHGIEALARAPGTRARARMLARALVPPRRYMLMWFPRAGRNRAWLALSYLWRPFWLASRAMPSLSAWRRARRETRRLRSADER